MKRVTIDVPRFGEIYLYNFGRRRGSVQAGLRPVMILQTAQYRSKSPVVVIAAITSVIKKIDLPFHVVLPEVDYLPKESMVLLEQLHTVPKNTLGPYCGRITDSQTKKQIREGLIEMFELKRNPPCDEPGAICICNKCLRFYRGRGDYYVRRVTPRYGYSSTCDICGRNGAFVHIIYEKYRSKASKMRRASL